MVSTSSLCKHRALAISAFKTRCKLQVSEDVIQSVQIVNTSKLRQSKNPDIQTLYTLTSSRHINHDCLINFVSTENQNQVLSNKQFNSRVDRKFNKSLFNHTCSRFMNLNEQQLLICHILKVCPVKVINIWQGLAKRLPSNIFNFCRKALILCLPNKSNLYRWKSTEGNQYFLYHHTQTQHPARFIATVTDYNTILHRNYLRHSILILQF